MILDAMDALTAEDEIAARRVIAADDAVDYDFNAIVAALSYFVYDFKIEPVILCLIYCFLSSHVDDTMIKGFKEAVKFEIVTDKPEELLSLIHICRHARKLCT